MYNCLPLYHSVGGVVATGAVLVNGGSVVIREKFSAQPVLGRRRRDGTARCSSISASSAAIWSTRRAASARDERIASGCAAATAAGRRVGSSSRRASAFRSILEFYAATEGNVSLYNVEGKPGAIGRMPSFLAHRFPAGAGEVRYRRPASRCATRQRLLHPLRAGRGRRGDRQDSRRRAHPAAASSRAIPAPRTREKKVLRDVFARGDAWFRTGDLMRRDAAAFSISSTGSATRSAGRARTSRPRKSPRRSRRFPAIAEANVYGVAVPGTEGRAGMAAIVPDGELDLAALRAPSRRPAAAPMPGRCSCASPTASTTTATFKHKKSDLAREGYDPAAIEDALYFERSAAASFRAARRGAVSTTFSAG